MKISQLPVKNLTRKPGRTLALICLTALLALSVFGGSVVVLSLRSGLNSLENRLGADIIVVPSSAKSQTNLKQMLLQGTTGYFYMDRSKLDKVLATDGVEKASPQLFLASLRASCCTMPIQVIGIDQETDFTVEPWIEESYTRKLELRDIVVGSQVNAGIGESLRIYGVNCPVVARLASTGTGLDTAVYTGMDTLRLLLDAARDLGHDLKISGDSADVISAVYVKVKDGCSVERVADDLAVHVSKTETVQTKGMITGVADSLAGISSTVTALIAAVWVLAFTLLIIVFAMMARERSREFAVLRVIGMSRSGLAGMIRKESLMIGLAGGLAGIALGAVLVFSFSTLIEQKLALPYLTPSAGTLALLAGLTLLGTTAVAMLASARAAGRLSRTDPGTVLREGN